MNNHQNNKVQKTIVENRSHVVNILLLLMDILTISLAVAISAIIRLLLVPLLGGDVNWPVIINGLVIFIAFNIFFAWLNGLYPGFGLAAVHEMQKILYVVALATIFLGVFLFLQQLGLAYSRLIFVLTWFLSTLFMMLGRFALRNRFSRFEWWGVPIVIFGSFKNAAPVIEKLIQNRRLGYRPVYHFDPALESTQPILTIPTIETKGALLQKANTFGIQHVIFTDPIDHVVSNNFHWMRDVFSNILFVLDTAPFGSLWVRTIDLHGTLVIETNYHLLNKQETIIKRVLDLVLTLLMLLVSWPLFLILAILIRIDSKGPILHQQKRLGQNGKIFNCFKFRTMHENAEEKLQELISTDIFASEEYKTYHKLSNDPRVTQVGRFLRRYSFDELPQLINVIKGDMNLIAPRGYLPRELPAMGDYAKIILKVKPGITGWWQVMGRNETSFQDRLLLDEYYISNWSVWLDIYIVIKTVWVLIKGEGL